MTKRMLLDASHQEETRVVVLSGNKLEDFDYERKEKKPLKGNIYLAKVTRVEPSLQAAFVDYGGNRHGFLPFSEIHPDYYRLPVADREALLAEEQAKRQRDDDGDGAQSDAGGGEDEAVSEAEATRAKVRRRSNGADDTGGDPDVEQVETGSSVETLGGDEVDEGARRQADFLGRYKIQEVIKRRQVILVQVVKEERGNKGAALTTYLSLAGRYCVLMPNTNRGGGISRKIASTKDRRRLKNVLSELEIPEGMAVIVRTAGSNRTKAEIKRDYEYLLRLWDQIRETTLQSTAPALIYEEANLIKRAIRDLYTRDMDEVLVEGEEGYKAAKAFMRSIMPSHAKKVQKYHDVRVPLFHRYQVEDQIDNIHNPVVQLRSGGYIVINQTEALVAIDVNSGKATRERHIEETALKTNLEAAEEVARQLKLRDLAGLIVVDFIDMDSPKNNREVEQRLKDAMRQDRARIQLGRISPFGLLELSRQRLRPSLHETSTEVCRTCGGSGFVRSADSTVLHVLRALEEEGINRGGGEVLLTLPTEIALFALNEKRGRLIEIEQRYNFRVRIDTDNRLIPPAYRLERLSTIAPADVEAAEEEAIAAPAEAGEAADAVEEAQDGAAQGRKRGKRGGRKKRKGEEVPAGKVAAAEAEVVVAAEAGEASVQASEAEAEGEEGGEEDQKAKRRRRRGKRGGRRRSRRREEDAVVEGQSVAGNESVAESEAAGPPPVEDGERDVAPVEGAGERETAAPPELEPAASDFAEPPEAGQVGAAVNAEAVDAGAVGAADETGSAAAAEAAAEEAVVEGAASTQAAPAEATPAEAELTGAEAVKPARKSASRSRKAGTTAATSAAAKRSGTKSTGAKSTKSKAAAAKSTTARGRRTTAKESAEDTGESASAAETQAPEAAEDAAPQRKTAGKKKATTKSAAAGTAEKKTRGRSTSGRASTSRTRKTAARKTAEEAPDTAEAAQTDAAPSQDVGQPEATPPSTANGAAEPVETTRPSGEASQRGAEETQSGEAAESFRDDQSARTAEKEDKPKRRGWWQKLIS